MNRPLKALAGALIAFGIVGFAAAQDAGPAAGSPPVTAVAKPHKNFLAISHELLEKMNFSDAQKAQLTDLWKKTTADVKALRQEAKTATDKAALKEKRKALQKTFRESLKTILTPAQQVQLKGLMQEHRLKQLQKGAAGTAPAHP